MTLRRTSSESGFSLVEVLMALVVTTIGTLSVATLMAYGTKLQTTSRDTTTAAAVARQQMERLRMLPPLSASRAIGGSLTADVTDHSTIVTTQQAQFRVRWVVTAGPASTKEVNIVVLSGPANLQLARVGGTVWP
jgi:prepilin-type N-terminal cleavage/methylation domain-containing protein